MYLNASGYDVRQFDCIALYQKCGFDSVRKSVQLQYDLATHISTPKICYYLCDPVV